MARRRRLEEHENHERWLVSYADFITLLFAFFVVMYATSSVNEGKYRVLSDSLLAAFSGPTRSLTPVQVGEIARSPIAEGMHPESGPVAVPVPGRAAGETPDSGGVEAPDSKEGPDPEPLEPLDTGTAPAASDGQMSDVASIAGQIEDSLAPLIDQELMEVRRKRDWLEVEIKNSILFSSGSSRLVDVAIPVLEKLADILGGFPNPIQVEGFTDNVPIHTTAFPSNWELSAARAASVVHLFMKYGVRPERMVAIGYGQYRPVADNASDEGRSKNRRVVIVVPAARHARQHLDLERMRAMDAPAAEAGKVPAGTSATGPAEAATP